MPLTELGGATLRELKLSDVDAMVGIESSVFPAEGWSASVLEDALKSAWNTYLGLFVEEKIVGYGGIQVLGDQGELHTIGLLERWRGRGFGAHLLDALLQVARDQGAREVFLEVRRSNTAVGFYKSRGFKVIDRRARYYRDPVEDALIMRTRLYGGIQDR